MICQVALASILGVWHGYGFTRQILPDYIMTYCRNFIMALPLQLIIVGPLSHAIFRAIYGREEQQRLDAEDERVASAPRNLSPNRSGLGTGTNLQRFGDRHQPAAVWGQVAELPACPVACAPRVTN